MNLVRLKRNIKSRLSPTQLDMVKLSYLRLSNFIASCMYPYARFIKTPFNVFKNRKRTIRKLEIGPGSERIDGFETVNVIWTPCTDYIADASRKLPLPSEAFEVVYASHVLEHTPWYRLSDTLKEWLRVLKPGGTLEVWIPDGYKLAKFFCDTDDGIQRVEWLDNWRPFNSEDDPYKWANGRMLYGARTDYPSWHTAIITPGFLEKLFCDVGLENIQRMNESETRGVKHGWINLGMKGTKP